MERIIEIEKLSFESEYEKSLRPKIWEDYIGQEQIKKIFRFLSKQQKREMRHSIISSFLDLPDLEKPLLQI